MASTRTGHSWAGTMSRMCRTRISAGIWVAFRPMRPTSVAKASVSSSGTVDSTWSGSWHRLAQSMHKRMFELGGITPRRPPDLRRGPGFAMGACGAGEDRPRYATGTRLLDRGEGLAARRTGRRGSGRGRWPPGARAPGRRSRPRPAGRSAAAIWSAVRGVAGQRGEDLRLEGQHRGGRLLAGLDARLMVGVDVHQRARRSPTARSNSAISAPTVRASTRRHRDGHRLAAVLVERRARAQQEAVQIVAGGDAGLDLQRRRRRDPRAPR